MSLPAVGEGTCYAVCALPRSGSWLLSLGLEDSGLAGRPRPYLCGLARADDPPPGHTRLSQAQETVTMVRRRHATANAAFGIKIESTDLPELMRHVTADGSFDGDERDLLDALFPGIRYVYLARDDKTRQALSLLRGLHTHRWMSMSGPSAADDHWAPAFEQVDAVRAVLAEQELEWEAFFSAAETQPHRVRYEELARDEASYRAVIYGVLDYLGISAKPPLPPARLNRQADQRTDELVVAYEAWRAAERPPSDCRTGRPPLRDDLSRVASLPRAAHMMLGDGRLSIAEAMTLPPPSRAAPRPASLGSQLLRALDDSPEDLRPEQGGMR